MKGWVTINTDAGFYPFQKVGSYAYWIRGDNLHLHGSGMLKGTVRSSTQAEAMAIANALHVLKCSGAIGIIKIVFNRDNIYAKGKTDGNSVEKKIHELIKYFHDNFPKELKRPKLKRFIEYRHVRAHSGTDTPRQWVNDWLDRQCSMHLKEWKKKQRPNT